MMTRLLMRATAIRVLVAGDCMLDTYVTGATTRISPEAPVPVVEVGERHFLVGGAANVAANARGLGAAVTLADVTGADACGVRSAPRGTLVAVNLPPGGVRNRPAAG